MKEGGREERALLVRVSPFPVSPFPVGDGGAPLSLPNHLGPLLSPAHHILSPHSLSTLSGPVPRSPAILKAGATGQAGGTGGGGGAGAATPVPPAAATTSPTSAPAPTPTPAHLATSTTAYAPAPHHLDAAGVWARIRAECERGAAAEPALASFLHAAVLVHPSLAASVAAVLANKLASRTLLATQLAALFGDAYASDPSILDALVADVQAVYDRDPACEELAQAVLYFKGFQAVQAHRVGHWLWGAGRRTLAVALQSRVSEVLHVDIHPAAVLGRGLLVDHATGVVIGETAVVGDSVSLLHHVTLGGSGTGRGVRHPRIGDGVLLGAGVCVLGPVTVGAGSKVGAGSVVVSDLPPRCVAVGVPARIVRTDVATAPGGDMNLVDDFIEDYQI